MLYFERIPHDRTVDDKLYRIPLKSVYERFRYHRLADRNWILYQHDEAAVHRSRLKQEKLKEFDEIEVSPHSPDSASSN